MKHVLVLIILIKQRLKTRTI